MIVAQIILLSLLFSKKNQQKRPSRNGRVQNNLSRMALWSSWTWGQKNHMGGFFFTEIPSKKGHDFFYSVNTLQCEISLFCIRLTHAMTP